MSKKQDEMSKEDAEELMQKLGLTIDDLDCDRDKLGPLISADKLTQREEEALFDCYLNEEAEGLLINDEWYWAAELYRYTDPVGYQDYFSEWRNRFDDEFWNEVEET